MKGNRIGFINYDDEDYNVWDENAPEYYDTITEYDTTDQDDQEVDDEVAVFKDSIKTYKLFGLITLFTIEEKYL